MDAHNKPLYGELKKNFFYCYQKPALSVLLIDTTTEEFLVMIYIPCNDIYSL